MRILLGISVLFCSFAWPIVGGSKRRLSEMERCVEVRGSKNKNVKMNKKTRVFTYPRGALMLEDVDCF